VTAFSTLNVLPAAQLDNLNELGYLTMTPVQAAALPAILEGRDVRVQAKTGSGKTAAFGLGLLQHIDAALFQTQSLVLCPTRELADQVAGELRRLARFLPNTKILTLCGGQPFGAQRDSLQHAPHIIVATPGRLLDHLQKGTVSLDALQTLVMDEADRMLDMGFSDAIDEVIRLHHPIARRCCFLPPGRKPSPPSAAACRKIRLPLKSTVLTRCQPLNSSSLKPRSRENPAAAEIAEPASACVLRGVL
jgi:superfamily II DNA/RNA helicase